MAAVSLPSPAPAPLWQRVLPHVLAVLFFALLAVLYFSPIVFDGKSLAQHDIVQFQGGAHEIQQWAATHGGHEPLWTNSMFSGMPAYLISVHFPGDWSVYLQKVLTLGLPPVVGNIFLALLCGYLMLIALGLRPLVAVVGAVAVGLASYNLIIIGAGHNTKSFALAYAPLVLGGLLVTFRRDKWLGLALFTLGLTMNIRANHLQITYYLLLLILIFGIIELVAAARAGRLPDFLTRSALLGLGALIAVGVSFGRLYTTYEYTKASIRGPSELKTPPPTAPGEKPAPVEEGDGLSRDYAFGYNYGIGETLTLLVPNMYGGGSKLVLPGTSATGQALEQSGYGLEDLSRMPVYWGPQGSTNGPVYAGAIVCFLFVLGLFVVDRRTRYWLLAGTILSILLAWGKNFETFNYLIFDYLPGYNKFRAVSMALVIAQLTMPLLALLALARVLGVSAPKRTAGPPVGLPTAAPAPVLETRQVLYAGAITAGLCLLVWIASFSFDFAGAYDSSLPPALLGPLRSDRADLLRNDVWRSLLFIGLALATLYFYLRGTLSRTPAALLMAALVLLDLWGVDKRYLNDSQLQPQPIAASFEPSPADQQILQDKDLSYRVLNLNNPFNEAETSYFHKSIGGYHGAKLRRYQDLVERQMSGPGGQHIFDMLNTRYIIPNDPKQAVQRNPGALGNAWFVRQVQPAQNPDQEIAALSTIDPATTAVVDVSKFPQQQTSYDPTGSTIALTEYAPDRLLYRGNAAQPGLVVFSEIYYADGWNAYLNGKLVPHLRADYVLRALPVPAGPLQIEFKFEPKAYAVGNTVSLVSSIALVLLLLSAVAYARRREAVVS